MIDKYPGILDELIDKIFNLLFAKGLDKNLEFEIDKYGRGFAYRIVCYKGVRQNFIRKLCKNSEGGQSIFMGSRPKADDRYRLLKKDFYQN